MSKLDKLRFSSAAAAQAESFRKMLLAMSRDLRVVIVKLADRVHNMRTLGVMRPEKCARIANETLDIYVPIAHQLGMNNVFRELQELSFANRYPLRYKVLYENVLLMRNNRRAVLERILNETKAFLPKQGIRARIIGRDKTIYGIYNKMRENHQSFSDALDIYGFRVIVRSVDDCYLALGALHRLYKPIHRRFKDFIAIPKLNGYQSLHTTVIGPYGTPVEFQIRTEQMHQVAENGILTQWMFKNDFDSSDIQSRTAAWLQSLMEIQRTSQDSSEFIENIKSTSSPTDSTPSRRRARSSPCPEAAPPSTSRTRSTRTWATTRTAVASTARTVRSPLSFTTATWWRSSRLPTPARAPNGLTSSTPVAPEPKFASICATAALTRPQASAATCSNVWLRATTCLSTPFPTPSGRRSRTN